MGHLTDIGAPDPWILSLDAGRGAAPECQGSRSGGVQVVNGAKAPKRRENPAGTAAAGDRGTQGADFAHAGGDVGLSSHNCRPP